MDTDEDQNDLYRIQLMQAFNMREYDNDILTSEIAFLFNQIKNCPEFIEACAIHPLPPDCSNELKICALFSFHTFDIFHQCIIDFFTWGGVIKPANFQKLMELIKTQP